MSDSADLDSYISTHVVTSSYDSYKIHLSRYHHIHLESHMLWKKLVQFRKGFFLIKKRIYFNRYALGTAIHNIEITLGKGGQLARAVGAVAKLIAKEGKSTTLRLPSREVRLISKNCLAIVRQVGNVGVNQKSLGRAGSKCWLGKRLVVRGVVMNPIGHPHGGGEGRAPIGRKRPMTPWGYPALGKSRKKKRYSDSFILHCHK
ncbi:unnamed protein product [Spirodela intermedia]|uniref:Large ribosomal subunit protein uL2 C-terminal domain-containing protein n=1 Tax=Spirodela intermedia TaxID=51605 RepID=A0ABN7ED20_SPIIN|nr:unnamed protein product [Spirodela intermedia]